MINQPNYTQCPNVFFDEILKELSGSETKVFCVIMRKTFGWQKTKDRISYSQIMEMSGIVSKATISEAIKNLEAKGFIVSEKDRQTTVYAVNVSEIEPVQKMNRYDNCTDIGTEIVPSLPKTGTKTVHTKESNINKIKKIYGTYNNVKLTDEEKERLIKDFHSITDMAIQYLSEYKIEKGYKTKDDNLTIRRWVIDAVRKREGLPSISKPLPIPDKVPREKKKCPKCGGDIRGSACVVCYTNFDYQGNEI
jgi:phage replication O-like protein O